MTQPPTAKEWYEEATSFLALRRKARAQAQKEENLMATKFKGKNKKADKPRVSALGAAVASSDVATDRDPQFDPGSWLVTLTACEMPDPVPGKHPWLVVRLNGEDCGDRVALFCISQRALAASGPRIRSLCMALVGMTSAEDADYGEFDPHGEFVDLVTTNDFQGAAEYFSAKSDGAVSVDDALAALTSEPIVAHATKGSEAEDGSFYTNVSFKPAPEEPSE
jgi:hypothetical protein